jgi:alpha-beta hydrolase superfamily lysophospholipase
MENGRENTEADKNPLSFKGGTNTIVVIHGAWSPANDWNQVAGHLISAGSNVITVNLPGHGSDETPVVFSQVLSAIISLEAGKIKL